MKKQLAPFVRSLPLDIPVAEVIKRARAAGLELKPYHVYQTRTEMRRKAKAQSRGTRAAPRLPPSELEREFRRAAGLLGLDRAHALIGRMQTEAMGVL